MTINRTALLLAFLAVVVMVTGASAGQFVPRQIEGHKATGLQKLTIQGEFLYDDLSSKADIGGEIYTSSLQGGEDISTATPIPGMPFVDSGTTTGYANDYDEACTQTSSSPEVVYSYTPVINELMNINLCESNYATKMYIYRTNEDTMIACNQFDLSCTLARSALFNVELMAGVIHYIVIDGSYNQSGDYIVSAEVHQPVNPQSTHPAMADAGKNNLMLAFPYISQDDTALYWQGSNDDGVSWSGATSLIAGTWDYPTVKYWGEDTAFYGTHVEVGSGNTNLVRIRNQSDPGGSYDFSFWDWNYYGVTDQKMTGIGVNNDYPLIYFPDSARFGVISLVNSYPPAGINDGPMLFYLKDTIAGPGWASLSFFDSVGTESTNGCATTKTNIDPETGRSYSVFDWLNASTSTWELLIWMLPFYNSSDPDGIAGMWSYAAGDPGEHIINPAVDAYNGNVLIAVEYYADGSETDHNIICFYSSDSTVNSLVGVDVAVGTGDARYPEISHVVNDEFIIVFWQGDSLFSVTSTDAGASWDIPVAVVGANVDIFPAEYFVVGEYRSFDLADKARKLIWEYQTIKDPDSTILLNWMNLAAPADVDQDGVPDDDDNCIDTPNPGQDDLDGDTIGDLCDECTDTDGDGYGNPGYAANTCTTDNCPDIPNLDQADLDGDGIGDICDDVCCRDRGDVDHGDNGIDISDLVYLVDYMFNGGSAPTCPGEADVDNAGGGTDISDLVYLVDYMFNGGLAPVACL